MNYLLKRNNTYYYNRYIPKHLQPYIPKKRVRISLKTDSLKEAKKLAHSQNLKTENYWKILVEKGETYSHQHYKQVVDLSNHLGFAYYPMFELINRSMEELGKRLDVAQKHDLSLHHVEALCGGVPIPAFKLSNSLPRYLEISKDQLLNKSEDQKRKWRNPRAKAWRNFLNIVPDKAIHELTREDMLAFRDWQIDRIENEEIVAISANKDLIYASVIIKTVAKNQKIRLDKSYLFDDLLLDTSDSKKRLPFASEYLTTTLLNPQNLKGLNPQARAIIYAFAETGAGPSELVGLLKEDIRLDHEIPHIHIVPRKKKALKTKYRERTIPLVGYALDVFKEFPEGFTQYYGRPDSLSGLIGKYLKENKLIPSEQHTLYSLRHNFQDRLVEVDAIDRVQVDLMGHKLPREDAYGIGSTLAKKLEWLKKIQLKKE